MSEQIMNNSGPRAERVDADTGNTARIRELNDAFRRTLTGGRLLITAGVGRLPDRVRGTLIEGVRAFDTFSPGDDTYGEHDFGAIEVAKERYFWRIEYYDCSLRFHSPDTADPNVTIRILTILCADEY